MSCNCLFSDYICKCIPYNEFIQVNTSLTPGASYTYIFTDKFDNQYSGTVVAESDGTLQVPIAGAPDGMFSASGTRVLLEIQDDSSCEPIRFPLAKLYDGIEIEVKGGSREKNTIGCEVQCSGGGSSNILIPFTDAATVSIDYSAYIDDLGNNPTIQVYHQISPGVYQLVSVTIQQIRSNNTLTDLEIDNGGIATGYVLLS